MGQRKPFFILFFTFFFAAAIFSLFAQEKQKIKVAVLPPSASGDASSSIAQGLTSVIVTELSRSPSLEVSDRRDVEKALKEQAFGLSGCTDQHCQIEIGKILQSKWVVTGDLNKIGTLYILTLKILNVETSQIVYQDEEEYKGEVEGLVPKTKTLASRLANFLLTGKKAKVEIPPIKIPKATKSALLKILSTPSGARVIFNNKERGETPLTLSDVPAGTYKIVLKKQGYKEFWGQVTLGEGEEKDVSQTLVEQKSAVGGEMVLIPAGEFYMGSDEQEAKDALELCKKYYKDCFWDWFKGEVSKHKVYLDAYSIDKYEVTNAQYRKCVLAGKCKKPWETMYYDASEFSNHPVVEVDWYMAEAYCKWARKRLPTEAEWEKAARGVKRNIWPWGNEWDCTKSCNSVSPCKKRSTCAVGSFPDDVSPYGVYDLAGNVQEWVLDWYDEGYYKNSPEKNPKGPNDALYRKDRGGSWYNQLPIIYRGASRFLFAPGLWTDYKGFRCAKDAE